MDMRKHVFRELYGVEALDTVQPWQRQFFQDLQAWKKSISNSKASGFGFFQFLTSLSDAHRSPYPSNSVKS